MKRNKKEGNEKHKGRKNEFWYIEGNFDKVKRQKRKLSEKNKTYWDLIKRQKEREKINLAFVKDEKERQI